MVRAKNVRWQELEKDNIPLERLARHFNAYNRSEGKSPSTVEWYGRVLGYFGRYLEEQGHSSMLRDLTLDVARDFVLYLQTRRKWDRHPSVPSSDGKLTAISVQNYVRGLRAFFSWLHREGYTEENILAQLKPPKAPQKLVEVLTTRLVEHPYDPRRRAEAEEKQIANLAKVKRERDNEKVRASLKRLRDAARDERASLKRLRDAARDERVNLIPVILEVVKAYASIGEICGVLREVFGEYQAYNVGV